MPVHVDFPLLGHQPAVAVHDNARLIGQPRLQFCLSGLLGNLSLWPLGDRQNSSMWSRSSRNVAPVRHRPGMALLFPRSSSPSGIGDHRCGSSSLVIG